MELLVTDQIVQGFYSAVFGVFCAFLYCVVSAIRIVFTKRGSLLSYLFDFLYCLIIFILLFLFVNNYFGGVLRGFMIIIIASVFLLFYLCLFKGVQRIIEILLTRLRAIVLSCIEAVFSPIFHFFNILIIKMTKFLSIIKKNLKKRSIQRKLLLKKRRKVVYNQGTHTKKVERSKNGETKKETKKRKKHRI